MSGETQSQPEFRSALNLNATVPSHHSLRAIRRRVDAVFRKLSLTSGSSTSPAGVQAPRPKGGTTSSRSADQGPPVGPLDDGRLHRAQRTALPRAPGLQSAVACMLRCSKGNLNPCVSANKYHRVLPAELAWWSFAVTYKLSHQQGCNTDEPLSADGTLSALRNGLKSFVRRYGTDTPKVQAATEEEPGDAAIDFRARHRRNLSRPSTTEPESKVALEQVQADRRPHWTARIRMLEAGKAYHRNEYHGSHFVRGCRDRCIVAHGAWHRGSRARYLQARTTDTDMFTGSVKESGSRWTESSDAWTRWAVCGGVGIGVRNACKCRAALW
jgi:hypothetical protein